MLLLKYMYVLLEMSPLLGKTSLEYVWNHVELIVGRLEDLAKQN